MQNSNLPTKWYKAFAVDDPNKVEIPITTADPTRASQSVGFPPLTMQPPESGGVPPQGEDFNGAMNQVARVVRWMMAGGALPFDSTWASNVAIGGYPQGARITAADLLGDWISTGDDNLNNPDTTGTNWVPGYAYGVASLTGLTNANVTLTPAQAAKSIVRLAGTLTGNVQIIFPIWLKGWNVINNCTGAFSVTCKTAAGAGAVISQGGGAQIVCGDGTNLTALGGNSAAPLLVGPATLSTHALPLGQAVGRLVNVQVLSASGTYTRTGGATSGILRAVGGGAGGGSTPSTAAGQVAVAAGGQNGAYGEHFFNGNLPASQAFTIGAGGGSGAAGGASIFGALTAPGGQATGAGTAGTPPVLIGATPGILQSTGFNILNGRTGPGGFALAVGGAGFVSGAGADSAFGPGAAPNVSGSAAGTTALNPGAGGAGASAGASTGGLGGGGGANGLFIMFEYA